MIAAAKQKVAIYSRRPAYDSRATRPKTGDKPLIHGGVRNHHHPHQQSKELHPLFLINEHWKIFLFLLHLSLNLSLGIINPNHRILPQPYSSPLSKHNLQPSMIKRFHCPNCASSQQFLIHHNQAFQTEPPKTDKHHTSCYCPLNETPLLSRISRAILGKVSP